jgi:hypothetical protein
MENKIELNFDKKSLIKKIRNLGLLQLPGIIVLVYLIYRGTFSSYIFPILIPLYFVFPIYIIILNLLKIKYPHPGLVFYSNYFEYTEFDFLLRIKKNLINYEDIKSLCLEVGEKRKEVLALKLNDNKEIKLDILQFNINNNDFHDNIKKLNPNVKILNIGEMQIN